MKIDETKLEKLLLNIGKYHELDETEIYVEGIKGHINEYKKIGLYSFHPFVSTDYTSKKNRIFLFPRFQPTTQISAMIKSYQEVFNGNCAIISCQMDEREFSFFEPNFNKERYQDVLDSQIYSIRLAAISISATYRDSDEEKLEEFFTKEEKEQIETKGYSIKIINKLDIFYTSIIDVNFIKKKEGDHAILIVKNPLDKTKELELIITTETFEDIDDLKQVYARFYFIGSFAGE